MGEVELPEGYTGPPMLIQLAQLQYPSSTSLRMTTIRENKIRRMAGGLDLVTTLVDNNDITIKFTSNPQTAPVLLILSPDTRDDWIHCTGLQNSILPAAPALLRSRINDITKKNCLTGATPVELANLAKPTGVRPVWSFFLT